MSTTAANEVLDYNYIWPRRDDWLAIKSHLIKKLSNNRCCGIALDLSAVVKPKNRIPLAGF